MKAKLNEAIRALLKEITFIEMYTIQMSKSIKECSKKRIIVALFFLIILALLYYFFWYGKDVGVTYWRQIVEVTLNLLLALFGIVFTGYAIFQAVLSRTTLIKMLEVKSEDDESYFLTFNYHFMMLSTNLLLLVSFTALMKIFLIMIPNNFYIRCLTNFLNEGLNFLLLLFYLETVLLTLFEIKSFIFNIFQAFKFYALAEGIEELTNHSNEKE